MHWLFLGLVAIFGLMIWMLHGKIQEMFWKQGEKNQEHQGQVLDKLSEIEVALKEIKSSLKHNA